MKKKNLNFVIYIAMIAFACISYLFYGIKASSSDFAVIGSISLNLNNISMGSVGRYFTKIKDVLAVILFTRLIVRMDKKDFTSMIFVLLYGIIMLFATLRFDFSYVFAGIRTFLFIFVSYLYVKRYGLNLDEIKIILKLLYIITVIQVILVMRQIISVGNLSSFGGGAYRYSGAFAGSGNLGCFCLATLLFMYVCYMKYNLVMKTEMIVAMALLFFLSVASGTRQMIILVIFYSGYIFVTIISDSLKFGRKSALYLYILLAVMLGSSVFQWVVNRIGRGALMDSGSGRFRVFMRYLQRSLLEIMFGSGLGWGTNASINLGITDTAISDSTINVIFAQFGLFGLAIFIYGCIILCYRLFKNQDTDFMFNLMFIILLIVMLFFGNLFEQIAMSIIIVIPLYLNIYNAESVLNDFDKL